MLDTLVKLASLGASGVCIFAIFWVGYLIKHTPSDNAERHRTLRNFMWMSVFIAVISGGSGIANAYFNREKISEARTKAEMRAREAEAASEKARAATERAAALSTVVEDQLKALNATKDALTEFERNANPRLTPDLKQQLGKIRLEAMAMHLDRPVGRPGGT